MIKNKKGRVSGPHNEREIGARISAGKLKGEELVAEYPAGKFRPLSAHPVFYEKILFWIQSPSQASSSSQADAKASKKDKTGSLQEDAVGPTRIVNLKDSTKDKAKGKDKDKAKPGPSKKIRIKLSQKFKEDILNKEGEGEIIEMEDVEEKAKGGAKRWTKPFLMGGGAALVLIMLLFFLPMKEKEAGYEPVRLLSLKGPKAVLTEEQRRAFLKQGLHLFLNSSTANYANAQGYYIRLLRDRPSDKELYIHLCLIYLKIWPFASQDNRDKAALQEALNRVSQRDREGVYTGACKSVGALINKKPEKALMTINSSLNALAVSRAGAFFYYLKARALQDLQRRNEAASYFKRAYETEKRWIAPYVMRAHILYRQGRYDTAGRIYQKALSLFPKQPAAGLRMGVLEYTQLNKKQNGLIRLKSILHGLKGWITPDILTEAYLVLADSALKQNNKEEALKNLNKAYALDPKNPDTINKLRHLKKEEGQTGSTALTARGLIYKGDVLAGQGKCLEAQDYFKQAFEAGGGGLAALKIAQCYWQAGAGGQAVQWLRRSINADRNRLTSYFLLADYLSRLYDFEGAREVLSAAKGLDSQNNYDLYKAYALISFRQKQYRAAGAYAERALKIYSFDAEIYILLSKAWRALGKGDKAFGYAEKAVQEDMNNIQAQIAYARALDLAYGFYKAEAYFEKLMDQFPLIIEYPQACGEYYFDKGKYDKALEQFVKTVEKNPKFKHAYTYMGRIYSRLSLSRDGGSKGPGTKFDEALKNFLQAALLDPADPDPVFYSGLTYMKHNERNRAEIEFEKILKQINPNYPLIHYYIALVNFHQGGKENIAKALKFTKTQMAKTPDHFLPYKLAGDIYLSKSQGVFKDAHGKHKIYKLCAREYQKALSRHKGDMEISIRLIECYKGAGDLDSALQLALRMTKKEGLSGHPEFYREIAGIYEAKDEYEKARAYYTDYFSLDPGAKDHKIISARIDRLIKEKNSITKPEEGKRKK